MKKTLFILLLSIYGIFGSSRVYGQNKRGSIDTLVATYAALDMFNGAILVAKQGQVIIENGYGKSSFPNGSALRPDTRFCIASLNKQFTSVLILQLVERGKLGLQVPISTYLPWYRKVG